MLVRILKKDLELADSLYERIVSRNERNGLSFRVDSMRGSTQEKKEQMKKDGYRAEIAVARALGLKWNGFLFAKETVYGNKPTDLEGIEVKSTRYRSGCLLMQREEKDVPFVFVIILNELTYKLAGWCMGSDRFKLGTWRDAGYGQPCFYIPQKELRDMSTFPRSSK